MERPTNDELHKRCRKDEPLIDLIHADKEPVLQHKEHGNESKGSGDDATAQHCARGTRATGSKLFAQRCTRGINIGVRLTAGECERGRRHLIARGGDCGGEFCNARLVWEIANRRALGRKVDLRLCDAVSCLEETLDPIDARGARHPNDRKGDLGAGGWLVCLHTPGEYRGF